MKNKINTISKVIPAYSYRKKNLFQAGKLKEKIKKQINKEETVKPYLWSNLHNYAKDSNRGVLVQVIEDGQGRDFNDRMFKA